MICERKLFRLKNYDYSTPGGYFVTKCIHDHAYEFGIIENGIIWISVVRNGRDRSLRMGNIKIKPIPELIGAFKTTSSKMIHLSGNRNFKWQKSFYDVIIRDDESYQRISEYIINNPANWQEDDYYAK